MSLSDPYRQLDDPNNLQKYKKAGAVAASVLDKTISMCQKGAKILDICNQGDFLIEQELSKCYRKVKYKGIAFPTCISLNNIAGHYSPPPTDSTVLKHGDLVTIELGVHIDGFPAIVAYTTLVNSTNKPIKGKRANVIKAVAEASKQIFSTVKLGKTNDDVVRILEKVGKKYKCSLPYIIDNSRAPGVMSFQMSRYVIDGYNDDDEEFVHKLILNKHHESYDFTQRECDFEENEVYGIDIVFSSGEGLLRESEKENLVMKRMLDERYSLKSRLSREALNTFKRNRFPVTVRNKLTSKFKFGIRECLKNRLVDKYPVMEEKSGEFVARLKFTIVVRKNPILIVGRSMEDELSKIE